MQTMNVVYLQQKKTVKLPRPTEAHLSNVPPGTPFETRPTTVFFAVVADSDTAYTRPPSALPACCIDISHEI